MIEGLKRLWRAAPVALVALLLALVVAVVLGARMALQPPHFADPGLGDQPVAEWMTPGYIGHAYRIPKTQVIEALNAPVPPPHGPMTLKELAAYRNVPVEQVLDDARALIAREARGARPAESPTERPPAPPKPRLGDPRP
ncbi:MAG: hypothetical protein ACRBCL_10070 [Maritimibacter sp.]